jgi:hypothetical protein
MAGLGVEEDHRCDQDAADPQRRGLGRRVQPLQRVLQFDQPVGPDEAEDAADDKRDGDQEFGNKAHDPAPIR